MKYIIFENGEPVIFPDTLSHKEVAGNHPVKSAGFCTVETYLNQFDDLRAMATVWGESISLGKKSDDKDEDIIESIWR